jgi:hypothetical protein
MRSPTVVVVMLWSRMIEMAGSFVPVRMGLANQWVAEAGLLRVRCRATR